MQRLKTRFEMWSRTIVISLLVLQIRGEELWKKDMTDEVYIEASVEGLKELHLECTKTQMKVKIELGDHVEGFDGVVYTRGSYQMGKRPCFYDAQGHDDEELSLQWTFNQCKTKKEDQKKSNVIIIQQDDMLIYPGDMAFELICEGDLATIGIADPDPGAKPLPDSRRRPVTGINKVTFNSNSAVVGAVVKDEL